MKLRETSECPNCKPIVPRLAKLEQQLAAALQRIDELEQENLRLRDENAQLKQQLAAARKDSSTPSKPRSSDIVKPKKPPRKGGKKRKRGGQPGHKRPEFPLDMIDETLPYTLDCCPDCGGELLFQGNFGLAADRTRGPSFRGRRDNGHDLQSPAAAPAPPDFA